MIHVLQNGIKVIFEKREGSLTSLCIGFNAGALEEQGFNPGTAHAVEHMLYKGTVHRTEYDINKLSDEIFAFTNAMTNYPYAIYYGTTLTEDYEKAVDLFSDILINPTFSEEGFREEMNIIREELCEWSEDPYQYCEDELLANAFSKRRIKELIIGNDEGLNFITLSELKSFYECYYVPENCVITVVSSLGFEEVKHIIEKYFACWSSDSSRSKEHNSTPELYEANKPGIFEKIKVGVNGAKIQYIFPIDHLNEQEITALEIFNLSFGEGTSSILYDEVRTQNGLAYDIHSSIKNERGMKLFTIILGTSPENIERVVNIIEEKIEELKAGKLDYTKDTIESLIKSWKLKKAFRHERAVEYCKYITTQELMNGNCSLLLSNMEHLDYIDKEYLIKLIIKFMKNPSVQIIKP